MKLRMHHIFCLLAFKNQGYSDNFVQTFIKMQKKYFAGEKLELVLGFDESCLACPHAKNAVCISDIGVSPKELDLRIMKALAFKNGQETDVFEIAAKINILSYEQLVAICDGCSWLDKSKCQQIIGKVVKDFLKGKSNCSTVRFP